jgi:hypothetical protein
MDIPYYVETCISEKRPLVPFSIQYEDLFFDELIINQEPYYFNYFKFIHCAVFEMGKKKPDFNHIDLMRFMDDYINKKKFKTVATHAKLNLFNCLGCCDYSEKLNDELEKMRSFMNKRLSYIQKLPTVQIHSFTKQQRLILNCLENSQILYIPTFYTTSRTSESLLLEHKYQLLAKLITQTWKFQIACTYAEDAVYSISIIFTQPIEKGRASAEIFLPTSEILSLLKEKEFSDYEDFIKDNYVDKRRINFLKVEM